MITFITPCPHCYRYFNVIGGVKDLNAVEMESQRGEYVLAHNGWVMNADPLVNFAAEGSQVSGTYTTCSMCLCTKSLFRLPCGSTCVCCLKT